MQTEMFIEHPDYSDKNVLIGLSGGINSMAVLCWIAKIPEELKPKKLFLFYAHFVEHSPDTEKFVLEGVEYAKKHFKSVEYKQTNNSVIDFFREQKMIPHPMVAPCTRLLKIMPITEYAKENQIDIDLIGYVKEEKRRIKNMHEKNPETKNTKGFPISDKSNEWCFEIVKKELGWYPVIYDILDEKGKRVFTHNNCLPCKNMQLSDYKEVQKYYPELWKKAEDLSKELKKHWGRNAQDFYSTFGREDYEVGFQKQSCEVCAFD
jgi:3'-phosphoadenosine 5'-phosphosulfate sulfotransferase (PAPS reductase)/FAD synthetase